MAVLGNGPVYLFFDGADNELTELLRMPDTHRVNFGFVIADILALSRTTVLVASSSSFSMWWASYLGRMPGLWHHGQLRQRLYYEEDKRHLEIETEGPLDSVAVECVRQAV